MGERTATQEHGELDSDVGHPSGLQSSAHGDRDDAPRSAANPAAVVTVGSSLGRFTVTSSIGGGGMGEVFAAHDQELGRTVALKVIRPDRLAHSPTARLRLMREAQALARLHHPNVVTVYEIGTEGEHVFLAMELIEGEPLSAWLRKATHAWREVLARFLAAGRGLAAAHEAGIIHRDFKPDNVVVGEDRVVVVDFGLARGGEDDGGENRESAPSLLETSLTETGDRCGTLPYMAPEQLSGSRAVPQSDQYAFCVSLWEGLHGERPTDTALRPRNTEVPDWANEALRRGLSTDPAIRWPSMQALLTELGRDRRAARNRALLVAGAAVLVATASWGLLRPAALDPCAGGATRVAQAWGPARQQAVHAAFLATKAPGAEDTFHRTRAVLDDYATRWAAMYGEACRATRVEGRQSDSMMDLRMECLERRRAVLGNLTALWGRGVDADTLEHAADAVSNLGSLRDCADTRVLGERTPVPTDPRVTARVNEVRRRLDEVQAQIAAHRLSEGRKAAGEVRALAENIDWPPLAAEASFAEGDILAALQDPSAEAPLMTASRLATAGHDDRLAARALIRLVDVLGAVKQNAARALLVADLTEGQVTRVGDDQLTAKLLYARGNAQLVDGKIDDAGSTLQRAHDLSVAAFGAGDRETLLTMMALAEVARQKGDYELACKLGEQTLAATIERLGPEHPEVIRALETLGSSSNDAADRVGAAAYFQRALALSEKIAGLESAQTANELFKLGTSLQSIGKIEEAERVLERALAIRQKVLPPEDPNLGATLGVLGSLRAQQGRFDEAVLLQQRTVSIFTKAYGPNHPKLAIALHKLGATYEMKGDPTTALAYFQKALDLRIQILGPDHEMTLFSTTLVGEALVDLHRCREARPLLEKTAGALAKKVGESHPDFLRTINAVAECDLAEGHPAQAVARLEHAVELEAGANHSTAARGGHRFLLARALWGVGRRREAVLAARQAMDELATEPSGAPLAADIQRWLETHR
ncbi:MAG TPA: serine/threonine-protein kinase [Kofleriaceae bacterium]